MKTTSLAFVEPFGPEIQDADAPDEEQDILRHPLVR